MSAKGDAPHRRVARYLVAKSAAELLFVAALALVFYLTAVRAPVSGTAERGDGGRSIVGRVLDASDPARRPELQLFIDGRHAATLPPAPAPGGATGGGHAYAFTLPPLAPGGHEARVYAVREAGQPERRVLRLVGEPVPVTSE